jgi:putative SOS response-associated peptidase YedK
MARWRSDKGDDIVSTCIITTDANEVMAPIHDRMPVILRPGSWEAWLGTETTSIEALKALLAPAPADGMVAHPVGTAVNVAAIDGEELIREI